MKEDDKDLATVCYLSTADVAAARKNLEEQEAVLLTFESPLSDKPQETALLSYAAADALAATLGRFGGNATVKIFAALCPAELCLGDIALLIGAEEADVLAEIERLEGGGFVFRRQVDGVDFFAAGNPPLKRFFLKRFAPHKLNPMAGRGA
ncbi:MAG: hypothetical protein MI741_02315 [Rhodospirillales bacterium]|nr:hypothetical protein [Rhodospirillales bacterium]